MTNAIGTGTVNLSINVPADERLHLGRLSVKMGFKSVGDLLRRLALKGLQAELSEIERQIHPMGSVGPLVQRAEELRKTLREVRQTRVKYYGTALLLLFGAFLVCSEHQEFRRARRCRAEEETEEVCEA